jgi:cobalt-zinc-cadmium resistance protein CzcA
MKLLEYLVDWSLENRLIVLMMTFIFVLFGINSAIQLKMDAVPDVTTVQVQIITSAPSLSPLEIEQYITFPVERTMAGIPHVEEVRSISRYGLSVVTIVFFDGTDIYWARQMVGERMKEANEVIPKGYGTPMMGPISTGLGEIYQFSLESDRHTLMELTTLLNWYINPLLKTVPGVVEVNTFGGETKQYQVIVSPERMQALNLSLKDVSEAIWKNNSAMGGGYIEHDREHYLIGSNGLYKTNEDIENVILGKTFQGAPITVGMVGRVEQGKKLRLGAVTKDNHGESVGAMALMLIHENSLKVTESIKEKVKSIEPFLPEGVRIVPFYDRSFMVKKTIKTVVINLLEGAFLVIVILFLLLGNVRAGLVIAVTIPLAMLFAIFLMNIRGIPGNLMSMGAVDFGLVVDGAVIIIENSVRRLSLAERDMGRVLNDTERITVIRNATLEVRKATIFGETIIAIVYLPILTMTGVEGKMFSPMAITVIYALAGAFVLSLTVIPVLASYFIKSENHAEHETPIFRYINDKYDKILSKFMNAKKKVVYITLIFFAFTVILFTRMGGEFLPELDEGYMLLEIARLPSVALSESLKMAGRLEKSLLRGVPEILHTVSKTGAPDIATDPMGMERTDMYLDMKDKSDWGQSKEEIIHEIEKQALSSVPDVAISVSMPIKMRTNELIAGIRSDIGLKIFGDDLETLKKLGVESANFLKKIEGVKDLKIEQLEGLNYIRILPKRDSLARYNVNIEDINLLTQSISSGVPTGYVFDGHRRFEIALKISNPQNHPLDFGNLPIRSNEGLIPLGDLAEIRKESGPVQVSHENGSRRMLIEFNVRERDMMGVVEEAQNVLLKNLKLPDGYRIEFGGKYKNYISARNTLMIVVPLTLILILFLLWLAFGELTPALLIFLNIPFSITGGILSLFIRGLPFSISAGVGFIALFGVAVLNGLVLISFAREQEHHGLSHTEGILEAAKMRIRPVLTTAIVAAIGFIPMAVSTSMGAEVQRPLATVVIGGLVSSSILTLLVIPVVYSLWYDRAKKQ